MGIEANVTNNQITASVGETQIDVSVSGGIGPTGTAGAAATITVGTVTTGAPGSSASVVNGGTGSAAVLNFMIPAGATGSQGPTGANGATGAAGAAATVSVGSVSTGAAGSSASVSNVGTSNAAVLNFSIPAGATGATGPQGATGPAGSNASATTDASALVTGTLPDARLSSTVTTALTNARTPTSHASTHGASGSDPVTVAVSQVTGLQTALDLKAPIANPTFTGTVRATSVQPVGFYGGPGGITTIGTIQQKNVNGTAQFSVDTFGVVTVGTWQATAIAVDYGGTGATTASAARANLGLVIGADVAPIANPTFTGTVGGITKSMVGLGNVDNTSDANKPISTAVQTALDGKQASGTYATLVSGLVPSSQLPSYVDDAIESANLASLPASGETGKIYVTLDTNKTYRWSGSAYIEISASPGSTDSVTEGSTNLYYTNARASAAAPVQSVAGRTGTVTLTKSDVGLDNVNNTSDASKPVSTATQTALDGKAETSHTHGFLTASGGLLNDHGGATTGTVALVGIAGPNAGKLVAATSLIGLSVATFQNTLVVNYGSTELTACRGNDSRLSDARTPTAHTQAWSTITATPTTLSGYGITDAAAASHTHELSSLTQSSATTGQVVQWNGTAWVAATPATYTLSNATTSTLGGVIVGTGLSVTNGTVSANVTSVAGRTGAVTIAAADVSGLGSLATQSGTFSGTSSGTNTGDQTVTLTGDVTGSGTGSFAATLASSGVTAGSYGSASSVATFTVDAKGRLTVAGTSAIAIAASAVSGTLNAAQLPNSGVTAGTYTSVTVDSTGRVTAGSNPSSGKPLGLILALT